MPRKTGLCFSSVFKIRLYLNFFAFLSEGEGLGAEHLNSWSFGYDIVFQVEDLLTALSHFPGLRDSVLLSSVSFGAFVQAEILPTLSNLLFFLCNLPGTSYNFFYADEMWSASQI